MDYESIDWIKYKNDRCSSNLIDNVLVGNAHPTEFGISYL